MHFSNTKLNLIINIIKDYCFIIILANINKKLINFA